MIQNTALVLVSILSHDRICVENTGDKSKKRDKNHDQVGQEKKFVLF